MLLKGILAAMVLVAGVAASAGVVLGPPVPAAIATARTLAIAPISLGNPAAAATLRTRHPGTPFDPPVRFAPYTRTLSARPGDTLTGMLIGAGVPAAEASAAIAQLSRHFDPRRIKPGQEIGLTFQPDSPKAMPGRFLGFTLVPDYTRRITVSRAAKGGFKAKDEARALSRQMVRAGGTIRSSLFVAGSKAGVPARVLAELIRAYSWDVDFQRDIRPNDSFEVMYEQFLDEAGKPAHQGRILLATLTLGGKRLPIYLHTPADGFADYFNGKGMSARKALMRTPIDGARLSSGYGKRRHPILGYTKMHRGVDFAAVPGTPIYAAGNGTVTAAGWNGGYGKYVAIRHNSEYSTAYAHMNRIKTRKGRRVKQGQVIGYVGTTGRSTGPHLHYEIMRKGRQTNPLKVKMPSGRKLKGKELERFFAARDNIEGQYVALAPEAELARTE